MSKKIAVIGAGPMGLALAYYLSKSNEVDIYEVANEVGGMASHFDFDGLSIEKFYHFICKTDYDTFKLLEDLDISDRLRWKTTHMGYFYKNKVHKWGDPMSLLFFQHIGFIDKIRYGVHAFLSTKVKKWRSLEKISAKKWLVKWVGITNYKIFWEKLLDLKFHEFADEISAEWLWTRIKRTGLSRKSIFKEELGYLDGGSQTLVNSLYSAIKENGGKFFLGSPPEELLEENRKVRGLKVNGVEKDYQYVISTIPTPNILSFADKLSTTEKQKLLSIDNIGVVCVLLKLKSSVSKNFWLNINDDDIDCPGIIEFSNLRDLSANIIYVPYYMPNTHNKFNNTSDEFINESMAIIKKIAPHINNDDLLGAYVAKLKHAQPICSVNFRDKLPSPVSSIDGFFMADTSFYYPEDRGISESIKYAKKLSGFIK